MKHGLNQRSLGLNFFLFHTLVLAFLISFFFFFGELLVRVARATQLKQVKKSHSTSSLPFFYTNFSFLLFVFTNFSFLFFAFTSFSFLLCFFFLN